ncbi:MAG: ribosome biogenesis GTP-binding protein YihA/YsxC [Treponema sp.]
MLKILNSEFIKSATKKNEYPNNTNLMEFAFFGRSNAGKSSLINLLLNRKNLVKVGSRPGMTQSVNFFSINASIESNSYNKKTPFMLTDLPGYGYAKLNKESVKNIDMMLYEYCTNRKSLKKMFLLMDIRRDVTEAETKTINFFKELEIKAIVVATKADKIPKTTIQNRVKELENAFLDVPVIPTSRLKGYGRKEILSLIEADLKG